MWGLSRKSFKRVDEALAGLKSALAQTVLCEHDIDGTVFLYAEASIASIDLVMMLRRSSGRLEQLPADKLLKVHLRELWTQFRLARLPVWAAFGMVTNGASQSELSYIYPEMLDASVGFDMRARRWLVRAAGIDALNALRERNMFDVPMIDTETNSHRFKRYPLERAIS